MLDAWLDDQMLGVTPRHPEVTPATPLPRRLLSLDRCFQPSHIITNLKATSKTAVIEELAALAADLRLIRDRTWFVGALIERENVMPSATGNGVAFLHTLDRHPDQVIKPFMVLGRSMSGVDFDALDGGLTHLFFVLGLKFHELYLPWLAKLPQMCARPETLRLLMTAPNSEAISAALAVAERKLSLPQRERSKKEK